jgi:hypothetical protein
MEMFNPQKAENYQHDGNRAIIIQIRRAKDFTPPFPL